MAYRARIESQADSETRSGRHPIGAHDRRRVTRVHVDLPVLVRLESGAFEGRAADLGIMGMFIHAAEPPAYGSNVTVEFESPLGRHKLRLSAVVRWSTETGFGIQFGALGALETHEITLIMERGAR
jgi:hypothetical protein